MSSEMQEQQMSSSASALEQLRPRTWRFDLKLHMQPLSGPHEVQAAFRSILNDAIDRIEIGLDQCSFSYGAPEEYCLADISGFLHGFNKISYPAVRTWIR